MSFYETILLNINYLLIDLFAITCRQTNQLSESNQDLSYYNINSTNNSSQSQREQYITRGKNNGFYSNKNNNNNNSLLRTRAHHNSVDEEALMASAKNDIDMRRHQALGFKHSLIH